MKKLLTVILSLFVAGSAQANCDDHNAETTNKDTKATEYSRIIHVKGMTCGGCVSNVKKALESVPKVEGVDFQVDINLVTLDFSKKKDLPKEDLDKLLKQAEMAIEKAHYQVVKEI